MKTIMWITRDISDELWIFSTKPTRNDYTKSWGNGTSMRLPYNAQDFPQVTWEGSPQQVEVEIKLVPQCREQFTANSTKQQGYIDDQGRRQGTFTEYHDNGNVRAINHYKDGEYHGTQKRWYDNGQQWSERNFKDGREDGVQKRWYDNGQQEYEHNYKDGKLHGVQKEWSRKWNDNGGKLILERYYIEDNEVTKQQWEEYEKGQTISRKEAGDDIE